jgi:hypothetical protein
MDIKGSNIKHLYTLWPIESEQERCATSNAQPICRSPPRTLASHMRFTPLALLLTACPAKQTTPRSGTDTASVSSSPDTATTGDTAGSAGDSAGETGGPHPGEPCETWGAPEVVGQVSDPSLTEISGLAVSRDNPGVLWVLEDSGASPMLTAINTTGDTLGTLTFEGVDNQDWEDLALGPCGDETCLWVGEFGDNGNSRESVSILWAAEPEVDSELGFSLSVTPQLQAFRYPEGPQDAEALVVNGAGEPYVLTKRTDITTRIYRVPVEPGTTTEGILLGTMSTGTMSGLPTSTTAADLWPDDSRLLVRGYLYTFEALLDEGGLESASTAESRPVTTGLEPQGEAIAYDPLGRAIWHVSEGTNPHLWRIPCES